MYYESKSEVAQECQSDSVEGALIFKQQHCVRFQDWHLVILVTLGMPLNLSLVPFPSLENEGDDNSIAALSC